MNKLIFVEGQDKTGKDTLVKALVRKFFSDKPLALHCIGPKEKGEDGFSLSFSYYENLLNHITKSDQFFILNRSHIGEYVYAPLYRDYSGDYIFDLESSYLADRSNAYLITLIDSSNQRLDREDSDALSVDESLSSKESILFTEASRRSLIKNKIVVDINNLSIPEVHSKAFEFILNNERKGQ